MEKSREKGYQIFDENLIYWHEKSFITLSSPSCDQCWSERSGERKDLDERTMEREKNLNKEY